MLVYILYILLLFAFRNSILNIPWGNTRDKTERKYLIFLAGVLILLTAIRGAGVGTDTRNYLIMYVHHVQYYSFSDIYSAFSGSPLTFYIFKFFSLLHLPPQFLLGFIEFIYISAIVRFINYYSKNKIYSFFCFFIIVGMYELSVPALKQCSAMGLVLHAFMDICNKKRNRAILCFILAYYFHKSSLVFILGVLLYYIRNRRYYYHIICIIALSLILLGRFVLGFVFEVLDDEHYMAYMNEEGSYSWVTFIYYFVLFFITLLLKEQYSRYNSEESRIMYGFVMIAIALQSLSSVIPSAFRLAAYFLPGLIILLPNSLSFNSKNNQEFKIIVTFIILFFYFYTNRNGGNIVPYKFFWQDYDIPYIYFGG